MRVSGCVLLCELRQFGAELKTDKIRSANLWQIPNMSPVSRWQVSHGKTRNPECKHIYSPSELLIFIICMKIATWSYLHLQIKAEEFSFSRRNQVIWQKWLLLSGHDYTTMVPQTEISLNGFIALHFPKNILNLDTLNETSSSYKNTLFSCYVYFSACAQTMDKNERGIWVFTTFNFSRRNLPTLTHKRPLGGKKCV